MLKTTIPSRKSSMLDTSPQVRRLTSPYRFSVCSIIEASYSKQEEESRNRKMTKAMMDFSFPNSSFQIGVFI